MAFYRMLLVGVAMFVSTAGYAGDKTASLELVFITSDYCPFCKAWEREVGPAYSQSPYGQKAPLRRVNIAEVQAVLPDIASKVKGTPVFLLLSENKEIGRIEGYQSREMFYWALSEYIQP